MTHKLFCFGVGMAAAAFGAIIGVIGSSLFGWSYICIGIVSGTVGVLIGITGGIISEL